MIRACRLVCAVLVLAGCADDPSGPGTYEGRVRSSTLTPGAVVLDLTGVGIEGIKGEGGTTAFWNRTSGTEGGSESFRVVLVKEIPGELNFSVDVSNLENPAPTGVVVSAVHGSNVPAGDLNSFSVELIR